MDWTMEWESAHQRSPLRVTKENKRRWEGFWNDCAVQYGLEVELERPLYQKVIDHLAREGVLRRTDTVMDVGCGPGTYSILVARRAKRVVGLDSSRAMTDEMLRQAQLSGLDNVDALVVRFEDLALGKYDLVLSALSPAVRDSAGLSRMERFSRRHCCYITSSYGEEMRTRNELWELVVGKFNPTYAYDISYPLNILLSERKRPNLKFISDLVRISLESEMVIRNFHSYFSIFVNMTPEKRMLIRDYIESRTKEGIFTREFKKVLAVMTWDVRDGPST